MEALTHEYWRFLDHRVAIDGAPNEPAFFYGVFSTDGFLISQLQLLDNIVEADDPRAIGCPQLGIPPNGGERFLNLAIFGGRKAGQQIFVVHISASVHAWND